MELPGIQRNGIFLTLAKRWLPYYPYIESEPGEMPQDMPGRRTKICKLGGVVREGPWLLPEPLRIFRGFCCLVTRPTHVLAQAMHIVINRLSRRCH